MSQLIKVKVKSGYDRFHKQLQFLCVCLRVDRVGRSAFQTAFLSCLLRQTTLAVYLFSLIGMLVYTVTLNLGHLWVVFVTAGVLG